MTKPTDKVALDNRSRQLNPQDPAYRDGPARKPLDDAGRNNRSRQLNPEHDAYRRSRDEKPPLNR